MGNNEYNIKSLFKTYGGWLRLFISLDFVGAVICAVLSFYYLQYIGGYCPKNFIKELSGDLLSVSASMFGILFAAFAIILSLSDEKFMRFLRKYNVLDKILFSYWLTSMLYVLSIVVNIIIKFFPPDGAKCLAIFSVMLFSWAIFSTIYLISDTIFFGMRRADYLEYEKEIEQAKK